MEDAKGAFECYVTQWGVSAFPETSVTNVYTVQSNIISFMRGWVREKFQEKALHNT